MYTKFCNGDAVYKKFKKEYKTHKKGLFIVAPSGAGKTHYIKSQKEKHWIDGDILWIATGAHPDRTWWTEGLDMIYTVNQRCDVITAEYKKAGFWIMGASYFWLTPDAIVIPDWRIHKKWIINREQNNYDGGVTSAEFHQVSLERKDLLQLSKRLDIPVFKTIEKAVDTLTKNIH